MNVDSLLGAPGALPESPLGALMPFPVYVGYDSKQVLAYDVCVLSLMRRSTVPLHIVKLQRDALSWPGGGGIFERKWFAMGEQEYDESTKRPFSTEFAFTRFLVPILQQYEGWALFCDSDFLFRADIGELLALRDDKYAVMCVKHDFRPVETVKMDGKLQTSYFRKNWSSFVLWNCSHKHNLSIRREDVNCKPGDWLHQFRWLRDGDIGELPVEWNWLEGVSDSSIDPKAVHYTRGGPWYERYKDAAYADEWRGYLRSWVSLPYELGLERV